MKQRTLILTEEAISQLEKIRDHDPRPYCRERAATLLKVADGFSPHWVAQYGLLKARDPDTVYGWLNDYQSQGLDFIAHRQRRKRFSPLRHSKGGTFRRDSSNS